MARTSRAHVPWSLECALKPDLRALLKKPLCPSTRPSPTAPSASPRPQTLLLLFGCALASRSRAGVRRHAEGPRTRGAGWERALWAGPRGLQPRPGPCPRRAGSAQAGDRGVGSLTPPGPPRGVPWLPLTCPMELRRRPPGPAPPGPAPQLRPPWVRATSSLPASRPGLPSREVFHLTSAFAASQMLKIPRHLSPGAYQGPEEGGGSGGKGLRAASHGAGRGPTSGRWDAGGGRGPRGTRSEGPGCPLPALGGAGALGPPRRCGFRRPDGTGLGSPALGRLSSARSRRAGGRSLPGDPGVKE